MEAIVKSMWPQGVQKWLLESHSWSERELQLLRSPPILHEGAHLSDADFLLVELPVRVWSCTVTGRYFLFYFFTFLHTTKPTNSALCFQHSGPLRLQEPGREKLFLP